MSFLQEKHNYFNINYLFTLKTNENPLHKQGKTCKQNISIND